MATRGIRRSGRVARAGRALGRYDGRLLRRAQRSRTPRSDRVMTIASRSANHSRLWLGVAAVLAAGGGTRGRRAASRGLLGIAVSSAIVNGPMKFFWRRSRPAAELLGLGPILVRMPTSFSFPSGHSASAVAFATGVAREWPAAGAPVGVAAGVVAYSRVHTGVHFPGDVVAGAGIGVAAGLLAGRLMRNESGIVLPPAREVSLPRRVVLLVGSAAGSAGALGSVKQALRGHGFEIVDELEVCDKHKLAELADLPAADRPLVIAAGGDGTVGAAADELSGTDTLLGILPLGTSNDVARSLGIPTDPAAAVRALVDGVVRAVDCGQVTSEGRPRTFVHAATVGFNVHFAGLATQSALRQRFGRFTYAVAGVKALQQHRPFDCELHYDGRVEKLRLAQLSVVNAPVFGGALDLRVPQTRMDDRSLVVIAVEQTSAARILLGALITAIGRRRRGSGIRAVRTKQLHVHVDRPVDVALDGEITTNLPADFSVAAQPLQVVTPRLVDDTVR